MLQPTRGKTGRIDVENINTPGKSRPVDAAHLPGYATGALEGATSQRSRSHSG